MDYVLNPKDSGYLDMEKPGRIEIVSEPGGVYVYVSGFAFRDADTCRITVAKACAWGRDVLAAESYRLHLAPGEIVSISGGAPNTVILD